MKTPSSHPEQQPGSQPNSESWGVVAQEGIQGLGEQVAAGQQVIHDRAELRAMEAGDVTLDPDRHIDRELDIRRHADDLVASGTHTPEEATAFMRGLYDKYDRELAESVRARGERDAASLARFGGRLTAGLGLQEYAGSSLQPGAQVEKAKPSLRERIARGKLGKWLLGGTVLAASAGIAGAVHQTNEANQAKFESTQAQIAPVIKDAMVDVDQQTLDEARLHPEKMRVYTDPNGHMGVTEFRNTTGNVKVVMGNTDGKPDVHKPLYVNYRNNMGSGEGTNGIQIVMTSPEGNQWVDETPGDEFSQGTDGGWAAKSSYEDTTLGEAEVETAQGVAKSSQQAKPYDPYR